MRLVRLVAVTLVLCLASQLSADDKKPSDHWQQKQFLISFWCAPPATDEHLARVAAEGYNLTWVPIEGLDVAQRHGLRAMLTSDLLRPETLDDPATRKELDALIEKVKSHPALEVYFITDEPGAGAFAGLGKLVAYLRERDPQHPHIAPWLPPRSSSGARRMTPRSAPGWRRCLPRFRTACSPSSVSSRSPGCRCRWTRSVALPTVGMSTGCWPGSSSPACRLGWPTR